MVSEDGDTGVGSRSVDGWGMAEVDDACYGADAQEDTIVLVPEANAREEAVISIKICAFVGDGQTWYDGKVCVQFMASVMKD